MEHIAEVLQAILIGLLVATFLLNTNRVLKAIELSRECLILLNNKALNKEKEFVKKVRIFIYTQVFKGYNVISDLTSAIECGSMLLVLVSECGRKEEEGKVCLNLAQLYQRQSKYKEAVKLYKKALTVMTEVRNKLGEGACYGNLGAVFQSLGEYVKAEIYLQKALVIRKQIGDKEGEATDYGNLGTVFQSLGKYVKAEEYHQKALVIRKQIWDKEGEASSYGNLGTVFQSLGEYVKAEEYLQKALVITKEIRDKQGQASSYGNLGTVFQSLGEYVKAEEYLQKALAIRNEIGDKHGEATSYGNLGTVFQSLGEYVKAEEYLQKALVIRKQIEDKRGEASSYGNLGTVFQSLGEYVKAEEYLQKALVITKEIGDKQGEALSYGNLGTVFQSLGEYVKAEEYYQKALVISKQIEDKKEEASSYGNLGTVFQSLGEYVKAEEYLQKALVITKEIGDKQGEASSYGNLGTVFHSLGEYVKAEEYLQKALVIRKEIGDKKGEASSYGNLGTVFQSLGEYVKAEKYIQEALVITKEIEDKQGEASSYGNLGTVFQSLGEYVKAEEYLQKALVITKEIGDKQGEASSYGDLGTVFHSLGEYVKAEEYLQKALVIRKEIGDKNGEAADYAKVGNVLIGLGDYVKAKEYFEKSLTISKANGCMFVQFQCHANMARAFLLEGNIHEAASSLSLSIGLLEKIRGFLRNVDEYKISLLDKHGSPYLLLSALYCATGKPYEALYVVELIRAKALADIISAQYSVEKEISVNPQSWVGIEKTMKKESNSTCLYISYYGQQIFLWILKPSTMIVLRLIDVNDCFSNKTLRSVDNVFADEVLRNFYILPHDCCEDRSLFPANAGDLSHMSSEKDGLEASRLVEEEEDENQHLEPPTLAQCYQMIIAPVADLLEKPEIIIVPDRVFYRVPFAALKDENTKYLSESFRIRIVPSLTTLKLIQDSPAGYPSQTGALIVGEPDVSRVHYKGNLEFLCPLPWARKEAEMIGRLLGAQPLLGEHATKQAVLERIHSVALIHFAAHGNAERGEIALAPPRSTNGVPQEEDYLLTMAEISQVRLRAKLVVLSCCHSARGQIRSEGVVGIARAFLGSGARSVLVALWALQDKATEQLMSRFYEHLVCGESASESLHQAMKWMRENGYSDVGQWAPFMLIGDNVTFDFKRDRLV